MISIGPVAQRYPRKTFLLNAVYSVLIFGFVASMTFLFFHTRNAASQDAARLVRAVFIEPEDLQPGTEFRVHFAVRVYGPLCPYEVHWSLIRKNDRVEVLRIIEAPRPAADETGDSEIVHAHRIPPAMLAGDYTYTAQFVDLCPNRTYTSNQVSYDINVD